MSEISFILDQSCEQPEWADAGVRRSAAGRRARTWPIVHAIYEGHRYARELEAASTGEVVFKRYFHSRGEICLQG